MNHLTDKEQRAIRTALRLCGSAAPGSGWALWSPARDFLDEERQGDDRRVGRGNEINNLREFHCPC